MARVKRGVTAHKRHKRLLDAAEGRKGTRSRLVKPAREALLHALAYATRDRKQRKRQMRAAVDRPDQRRGPPERRDLRRADRRPEAKATSSSTARSSPTWPSATAARSVRSWRLARARSA